MKKRRGLIDISSLYGSTFIIIYVTFNLFTNTHLPNFEIGVEEIPAFPIKCKPKYMPRISYEKASRLISVNKHTNFLPEFSNKILLSENTRFDTREANNKYIVREVDMHYTLGYACFNLYCVYDEKYRFESVYYDHQDDEEYKLCDNIYNEVIYLQAAWPVYGHLVYDGIVSNLFVFPADVVKRSMIAIRFNMNMSRSLIDILGIEHGPIIDIKPGITYACRILHVINPEWDASSEMYAVRLAVEQIRKNLKLDEIKPSIGLLNNRNLTARGRHIKNFDEIVSAVKNKYPNENFIVIQNRDMENFRVGSKMFAAAKYFIVGAGSAAINVIFMKPKTGISIIGSNQFDNHVFATCTSLDMWTTYCQNDNFMHFPKTEAQKSAVIDVDRNMKFIDKMIYAVNNQKWPISDDKVIYLWDYKKVARFHNIKIDF